MLHFIVVNGDENRAVVAEQFLEKLQARIHHAAPFVVAAGVLALPAHGLPDPFLELRLREIVVVNPALVARVVGRVNVDALDFARVRRQQAFERNQIVTLNDEIPVERGLFGGRKFAVQLQCVMRHDTVITFDCGFSLELNDRHRTFFAAYARVSSQNCSQSPNGKKFPDLQMIIPSPSPCGW